MTTIEKVTGKYGIIDKNKGFFVTFNAGKDVCFFVSKEAAERALSSAYAAGDFLIEKITTSRQFGQGMELFKDRPRVNVVN